MRIVTHADFAEEKWEVLKIYDHGTMYESGLMNSQSSRKPGALEKGRFIYQIQSTFSSKPLTKVCSNFSILFNKYVF